MRSDFSSCEFHSIDEFSIEKSNISIRHMNFDSNNAYMPKGQGQGQVKKRYDLDLDFGIYEFDNRERLVHKYEPQRRVINIKPEVHESKISYVV